MMKIKLLASRNSMTSYLFRLILNSKCMYSLPVSIKMYSNQTILKSDLHSAREGTSKVSTLFVPSRYAGDVYQIVKPHIDVDFIANNLGDFKLSCDHRGIELDVDNTLKMVREWCNIKSEFSSLVEMDHEYMTEHMRLKSLDLEEDRKIIFEKREKLLDKIFVEKNKLNDIEDILMPLLQKLPHFLHPKTPLQFSVVNVCKETTNMNLEIKSHTKIAQSSIEFSNNSSISYFLSGKVSELDFAIQTYFTDKMCDLGFTPLSCVDFCKSFIIEAVGRDPTSSQDSILLKAKGNSERGQKLHIVGGASLEALCAYLTNMNVHKETLPLKYFSVGRHYNAAYRNSKILDLFSVVQSTNAHSMLVSEPSSVNEFDTMLQAMLSCYSEIGLPFRTVNFAAKSLTIAESRRTQLELWSPSLKDYIPAAYVSEHDDFISKRLQITYGVQHEKEGYCNIVEGMFCNAPVLIGSIIENFQTKNCDFDIPDVLKYHFPSEK